MDQSIWVVTLSKGDRVETRTFDGRPSAARLRAESLARQMTREGWETKVEETEAVCRGCGGPDDHYPDCLPASQGGTMPDVVRP